jgi:hypothetical protein
VDSDKFQAGILLPCFRYFPRFPAGSGDFPAYFLQDPGLGTIALGTLFPFVLLDVSHVIFFFLFLFFLYTVDNFSIRRHVGGKADLIGIMIYVLLYSLD